MPNEMSDDDSSVLDDNSSNSLNSCDRERSECTFYNKIGACRHGDKCSRTHLRPKSSQTILLKNLYRPCGDIAQRLLAEASNEQPRMAFNKFYREVFLEISRKYGAIDEISVCDNVGEHMLGNVYVKFRDEACASRAVQALNNRWFDGRPIHCELSPVRELRDACCRQNENNECNRGGFCNFIHLKKVSITLKRRLQKQAERNRKRAKCERKPEDIGSSKQMTLPKRYQVTFSDESSWSEDEESSPSRNVGRSTTPFAFRSDRYASDFSDTDSETDPELEAHKQLLRRQRWHQLRTRFEREQKWDEDRERNFVFSLL